LQEIPHRLAYQDQHLVVDGLLVVVVLDMVLMTPQVLDRVDMVVVVMVDLQQELIPMDPTRRVTDLVEVVVQDLVLPLH
tara:strand:+ start:206 stop:442 length:237 start_codon:yes stop_codon:yes gene_type:complete